MGIEENNELIEDDIMLEDGEPTLYQGELHVSPYNGDEYKKMMLLDYEDMLLGKSKTKNMQRNYFNNPSTERNAEMATELFRYAFEKILQWSPEQTASYASEKVLKALGLLYPYKKLNLPRELVRNNDYYVAGLLYPHLNILTTKNLTLLVYRNVLNDKAGKFPKEYFSEGPIGQERAIICLQYMLKNLARFETADELFDYFSDEQKACELLKKYGLITAKEAVADTCIDYLRDAFVFFPHINVTYGRYRIKTAIDSDKNAQKFRQLFSEGPVKKDDPFLVSYKTFIKNFGEVETEFNSLYEAMTAEE